MRLVYVGPILLSIALGCGGGGALSDAIPTPGGYEARLQRLVGKSVNVAVAELGAPTSTVELAQGSKLYVWDEKSEIRTPITGTEYHDHENHADRIVIQPSERVPLDCRTELDTDAGGVVTRYRTEGIACVSLPPDADFASGAGGTTSAPAAPPAVAPAPPVAAAHTAPAAPEATASQAGPGQDDVAATAAPANVRNAARAAGTRAERQERRKERRDRRE